MLWSGQVRPRLLVGKSSSLMRSKPETPTLRQREKIALRTNLDTLWSEGSRRALEQGSRLPLQQPRVALAPRSSPKSGMVYA